MRYINLQSVPTWFIGGVFTLLKVQALRLDTGLAFMVGLGLVGLVTMLLAAWAINDYEKWLTEEANRPKKGRR